MNHNLRCDCKTQMVTNKAYERHRCYTMMCCGIRLQVVVDKNDDTFAQLFRMYVANVASDCNSFYTAVEVYPMPLDKDNIPSRNDKNYLYYATTEKIQIHNTTIDTITGGIMLIRNHCLSVGFISDPANGFADAKGNFDLSVMFAVNFDEPIEPELCYAAK